MSCVVLLLWKLELFVMLERRKFCLPGLLMSEFRKVKLPFGGFSLKGYASGSLFSRFLSRLKL